VTIETIDSTRAPAGRMVRYGGYGTENTSMGSESKMTTATCPDLRTLAGDTYRVQWETPLGQRPTPTIKSDPWLAMVPCQGGTDHIYPFGVDRLAVFLAGHRWGMAKALVAVGCEVYTRGDDGTTLTFGVALFARVAELTRARKRRHATPEAIQRGREALTRLWAERNRQSGETALVCPPDASVDLGEASGPQKKSTPRACEACSQRSTNGAVDP
jgi:hypothetical protein